jgi:hypothetical protein
MKAGWTAGLQWIRGSVSRDDRTAEFVVHPRRNHVDVLADRIRGGGADCAAWERVVRITHHQKWSYSIPAEQFGVKRYSKPTHTEAPSLFDDAFTIPTPPALTTEKLLFAHAPPPFERRSRWRSSPFS